jgi:hypothetical protein
MKANIKKAFEKGKAIKLRIDRRTVITVRTIEAFQAWLSKFPQAKIVS